MKLILIFLGVIIFSESNADEVDKKSTDYELGKQALAQNDCPSAIKHLEKYKADNYTKLQKQKTFLSQLEAQIVLCKQQLEEKTTEKSITANSKYEDKPNAMMDNAGDNIGDMERTLRSIISTF